MSKQKSKNNYRNETKHSSTPSVSHNKKQLIRDCQSVRFTHKIRSAENSDLEAEVDLRRLKLGNRLWSQRRTEEQQPKTQFRYNGGSGGIIDEIRYNGTRSGVNQNKVSDSREGEFELNYNSSAFITQDGHEVTSRMHKAYTTKVPTEAERSEVVKRRNVSSNVIPSSNESIDEEVALMKKKIELQQLREQLRSMGLLGELEFNEDQSDNYVFRNVEQHDRHDTTNEEDKRAKMVIEEPKEQRIPNNSSPRITLIGVSKTKSPSLTSNEMPLDIRSLVRAEVAYSIREALNNGHIEPTKRSKHEYKATIIENRKHRQFPDDVESSSDEEDLTERSRVQKKPVASTQTYKDTLNPSYKSNENRDLRPYERSDNTLNEDDHTMVRKQRRDSTAFDSNASLSEYEACKRGDDISRKRHGKRYSTMEVKSSSSDDESSDNNELYIKDCSKICRPSKTTKTVKQISANNWIKSGTFDGNSSIIDFFFDFENAATYNKWDEEDKLAHLKASLKGIAKQIFRNEKMQDMTFEMLRDKLKQLYGTQDMCNSLRPS